MLRKVMTVVSYRADEKNQTLIVNMDEKIPSVVVGDNQRLSQVITNLMDNAVKFTPELGKVCLDISLVEEVGGICKLHFEVTDSGIGISAKQQMKLFKPFGQVKSGMSREYGGTGLGLVISKNIVERMNGMIWVESEPGKGSKFIFTVKMHRSDKTLDDINETISDTDAKGKNIDEASGEFEGKRMLIAEDVEINREILISLLEETGLLFDCAVNGKEALDMVEADPDRYDIIFMDLQMPQMDGYEATRRIRALSAFQQTRLPIIALSANVFTSDIEDCIAAGMDGHLGKPLDIDKILEVLRRYLINIE
jgi:CheY-like chemotaxis protein